MGDRKRGSIRDCSRWSNRSGEERRAPSLRRGRQRHRTGAMGGNMIPESRRARARSVRLCWSWRAVAGWIGSRGAGADGRSAARALSWGGTRDDGGLDGPGGWVRGKVCPPRLALCRVLAVPKSGRLYIEKDTFRHFVAMCNEFDFDWQHVTPGPATPRVNESCPLPNSR